MDINISYDICSLILIFIIFCVNMSKKKTGMLQNSMFFLFIIMAFGTGVFDILCSYVIMESEGFSLVYKIMVNNFYMLFHNLTAFSFALYAMSITEAGLNNIRFKLKLAVVLPIVLSVFIMIFLQWLSYYDDIERFVSLHNDCFQWIKYIILTYYLLFGVIFAFANKDLTDKKLRIALYLYVIFVGGSSIVQYFVPQMPMESFGSSICIMLIFITVQKPEEFIDSTTDLFNKVSFARMFLIKLKAKSKFTIVVVHIEDMKMLVHAFGIDKINQIRKNISDFIESTAPKKVFSIGTSTFTVILNHCDEEKTRQYVKLIENEFEKKWMLKDSSIYITSRILDIKVPEDINSLELFYNYIDYLKGLDNSKKWIISAKDINLKDTKRRIAVENAIKNAIENDSFMVYYQPIYSIEKNKIISAEALVRLNDDELGFISPAEFIPISEQTGMILKIGEVVFEKVCCFIKENDLQAKGIEYIEINLSVVQCMQETLAIDLLAIMKKYGIENSRINLEITETAAAYSPKMLIKNMKYLFDNGVCFSLDDFGTGYSNINSLMNLPLDMIKFDKSMIDMATAHDKGKIILGSSIAMVKRMNLKIVAEGVETKEQTEMFAAMGIDYLQGYYFSKPVCEEEFVKYIVSFEGIDEI